MVTNSGPSFCTVYQIGLTAGSDPAFYSSGGPTIPRLARRLAEVRDAL